MGRKAKKRTELGTAAFRAFRSDGYQAYLSSDWWRSLKKKRLRGKCRGCKSARATQLHHTSYKRLGYELSSDTVQMCRPCHLLLHDFLCEIYPDATRGQTAEYTYDFWGEVFGERKASKKKKAKARTSEKKKRKNIPKKQADLAKQLREERLLSKIPLTPVVPQTNRPTMKPCGVLAGWKSKG